MLAGTAEWRIGHFTAQGLANTAWPFVMVSQSDAQLFMALAMTVERRIG